MIIPLDAENRKIVTSFVWTKHRNVTGRQTDRQNWSGYYNGLHYCEQCGRAVKILKAVRMSMKSRSVICRYSALA